jgi:hypothetical protein
MTSLWFGNGEKKGGLCPPFFSLPNHPTRLSFRVDTPKKLGHNALMTEDGCLAPEERHIGSLGCSEAEPQDRNECVFRRRLPGSRQVRNRLCKENHTSSPQYLTVD